VAKPGIAIAAQLPAELNQLRLKKSDKVLPKIRELAAF